MLDEGVVAEAQDIDLCLILGAGWPFHLGGITPYLDRERRLGARERQEVPGAGRRERPRVTRPYDEGPRISVRGPSSYSDFLAQQCC